MPTVTTTVTSASAAGATTTVTTTEAIPEDAGFTYDGTFSSWWAKQCALCKNIFYYHEQWNVTAINGIVFSPSIIHRSSVFGLPGVKQQCMRTFYICTTAAAPRRNSKCSLITALLHHLIHFQPLFPRIVKLTPEQIGKYLSFAKHLDAPAVSNAFAKVVLTGGDGLGGVRDIYLKGLAPGQFVREMWDKNSLGKLHPYQNSLLYISVSFSFFFYCFSNTQHINESLGVTFNHNDGLHKYHQWLNLIHQCSSGSIRRSWHLSPHYLAYEHIHFNVHHVIMIHWLREVRRDHSLHLFLVHCRLLIFYFVWFL